MKLVKRVSISTNTKRSETNWFDKTSKWKRGSYAKAIEVPPIWTISNGHLDIDFFTWNLPWTWHGFLATWVPWAYLRDPSKHFIPYSQQCHTNIRRRCLHGKCNCCFHKQWMLGDGCSVISLRASGSNGNFQKWRIETSSWVSKHLIFVNVVGGKFQINAKKCCLLLRLAWIYELLSVKCNSQKWKGPNSESPRSLKIMSKLPTKAVIASLAETPASQIYLHCVRSILHCGSW